MSDHPLRYGPVPGRLGPMQDDDGDFVRWADYARDVDRLRKEHAVACLQLLDRAFIGTVEEGIADLVRGKTDPSVVSLVRDHHQHPLDTCRRCGRPAPCREDDGICSWGCPS